MDNFDTKVQSILDEILKAEEEIAAEKAVKEQCDENIKYASKFIGELKGELMELLNDVGVVSTETKYHVISRGLSAESVDVTEPSKLEAQYLRTKVEPDKVKIKKALSLGLAVEGAKLSEKKEVITIRKKSEKNFAA